MSLLVLMYHRARAGRHGNAPEMLDEHFAHVARHYANVLPGEDLVPGVTNVCLSFDDGYFDFYATVFPLLQRHRLRALLAIPPLHILEKTSASYEARLAVSAEDAFANPAHGGFCTWSELEEMVESGRVTVAAHGYSHCCLDDPRADLAIEVDSPQTILRARLGQDVTSFVFPYGRFSGRSFDHALRRYPYIFRIGGAQNRNWTSNLLYRVDADEMPDPQAPFAARRLAGYHARYLWNRLRAR